MMKKFTGTPTDRVIAAAVTANVPLLIWGDPGEGKTARVEAMSAAWGRETRVVVGGNREAVDFLGYQIEKDGIVSYSNLEWAVDLAGAESATLILDELTSTSPSTSKAMLRVIQERFVGDFRLPDSVAIIALANPPESAADGFDLPAPSANRFLHLQWQFNHLQWIDGVMDGFSTTVYPSVTDLLGTRTEGERARSKAIIPGFLKVHPALAKPGAPVDPDKAGKAWASPRSWTNALMVLAELDPTDHEARSLVVAGCVGEDAAREFQVWSQENDLFDPEAVLNDPTSVEWSNERPDRLFVLMRAISSIALRAGDPETFYRAMAVFTACAASGVKDVPAASALTLFKHRPAGASFPQDALDEFAELFDRSGLVSNVI